MARRGNGEGSIRQRADGRWEARVRLPGGERVSLYGATRTEAAEGAARIMRDARLGVSVADGREPYGDYLRRWLALATAGKAESTQVAYELAARLHILPVVGSVRLMELAPYHIERVYTVMLSRGLTDTGQVAKVLRGSLAAAERQGLVVRNVARLVKRPRFPAREIHPFSPEEALAYLAGCAGDGPEVSRLGALLAVMLWTGLRLGEVMALRWREVDLEGLDGQEPCLRVLATARYRWGDPVFRRVKTDRSKRRVLLTPQAVEAFRTWRTQQRAGRERAGVAWRTSLVAVREGHEGDLISFEGLVFTDDIGRPLHQQVVWREHTRVCRAVGGPVIRPHDLRHTFATLLLSAGVNPKVVSEMLGHSSVNLTLTLYSHVLPHMQAEAVERLSHLLGLNPSLSGAAAPSVSAPVVIEADPFEPPDA
jgi:integrase